jgi:ATP-dependent DNA helicase
MSGRSSPEGDSRPPTTAPSSPPDIGPPEKIFNGLDDSKIQRLKDEERKAQEDNRKEELRRQKALAAKRRRAKQETAAEREAKARQLESLLAKSAVGDHNFKHWVGSC